MQNYDEHISGKYTKLYYLNRVLHRLDGPAIISYSENGDVEYALYYLLGKYILKSKYLTPGFVDSFILENS
jgi:hypothetical protein